MFENYSNAPGSNDIVVAESFGVGEQDIPEPLEPWSEQDFDDLVPLWGKP